MPPVNDRCRSRTAALVEPGLVCRRSVWSRVMSAASGSAAAARMWSGCGGRTGRPPRFGQAGEVTSYAARVPVRVLGRASIVDGQGDVVAVERKAREVLTILALRAPAAVELDELEALVWDEP